jgi:hypothetical protein
MGAIGGRVDGDRKGWICGAGLAEIGLNQSCATAVPAWVTRPGQPFFSFGPQPMLRIMSHRLAPVYLDTGKRLVTCAVRNARTQRICESRGRATAPVPHRDAPPSPHCANSLQRCSD